MSKLLKTAAKIGILYFILFSIIYIIKFLEALRLFEKYHSTSIGIDIAQTIMDKFTVSNIPGTTVFRITATCALIGAGIWFYQFKWGEQPATVS
jgi:hypothetical protein